MLLRLQSLLASKLQATSYLQFVISEQFFRILSSDHTSTLQVFLLKKALSPPKTNQKCSFLLVQKNKDFLFYYTSKTFKKKVFR